LQALLVGRDNILGQLRHVRTGLADPSVKGEVRGDIRHAKPIDRFREDLYLYSPKGAQYTADGLRARWGRWLEGTKEGRQLCRRWKEWVAAQVKKYERDIDPDDADHPTIHGLRGTGILARAEQG
jgi:hypothetical protein